MEHQSTQSDFHFKYATTQLGKLVEPTKPGGFRIPKLYFSWAALELPRGLHSHPDADELTLILKGKATVGITLPTDNDDSTPDELEFKVSAGDIVLFPQGYPHYIREDEEGSEILAIFNNSEIRVTPLGKPAEPAESGY